MSTNNIRQVRERIGLSQTALAAAIGISQGNISHYERQRQDVSPEVARRIIAVVREHGLHITFDDIYATPDLPAPAPRAGENPSNFASAGAEESTNA